MAGFTPVGLKRDRRTVENLRDRGAIQRAEDLGIQKSEDIVGSDRRLARCLFLESHHLTSLNFDRLIDWKPASIKDSWRKASSRYWLRDGDVFEQIKRPLLKS